MKNILTMPTTLYPAPVFGPVRSRRLGVSLGINLMPPDGKVCTFDCLYCECGANAERRPSLPRPARGEVAAALEARLLAMKAAGETPDVLTFAGNGEPTAHPCFAGIMDDTLALRDRHFPAAKISVLSNATLISRPSVRAALMKADNNILKLDTADTAYIMRLNRPAAGYDARRVIEGMKQFGGHVSVQTMFLHGTGGEELLTNTGDRYVEPWIDALREIRPQTVMIYTIDRETPDRNLRKAPPEELDSIAEKVRKAGLRATVSY